MKISGSDRRNPQRGLTLLELLIVLALLGLGMTAIGNVVRGGGEDASAIDTAWDTGGLMRLAQAEAGASGEAVAVIVDAKGRVIRLPGRQREVRLADGIEVSARLAREAIIGDRPAILFFPDGSSTGGRLTFSDGASEAVLSVHWLTSRISVESDVRD